MRSLRMCAVALTALLLLVGCGAQSESGSNYSSNGGTSSTEPAGEDQATSADDPGYQDDDLGPNPASAEPPEPEPEPEEEANNGGPPQIPVACLSASEVSRAVGVTVEADPSNTSGMCSYSAGPVSDVLVVVVMSPTVSVGAQLEDLTDYWADFERQPAGELSKLPELGSDSFQVSSSGLCMAWTVRTNGTVMMIQGQHFTGSSNFDLCRIATSAARAFQSS